MQHPQTVQELIDLVNAEYDTWQALIEQIDPEKMLEPGVSGEWSLKDVIAHLTWHENEMIGMIRSHAFKGSDLWDRPLPAPSDPTRPFESRRPTAGRRRDQGVRH